MSFRPIKEKKLAQPFTEGAGVSLFRAFGFSDPDECDPFLMLDDFRNDDPEKFKAGFCLLYTSPSPRDGLLSRMPSSA